MTALTGVAPGHQVPVVQRRLLWVGVLFVALATWSVVLGVTPSSLVARQDLADLARNLASGLFLVAGVERLVCWRLMPAPYTARRAIALLALGAGLIGASAVGPLLHEPATLGHGAPSTRALFLIPVVAVLLPGPHWSRQTFRDPIPVRFAVLVAGLVGTVLVGLLLARQWLPLASTAPSWRLICALTLVAWLVLGQRAARAAVVSPGLAGPGAVAACFLLAASELVRLVAVDGFRGAAAIAPGFVLAAAAIVVVSATNDLRLCYAAEQERSADLTRAFTRLQQQLDTAERADRERLHDARSAVVGVLGASELLGSSAGELDSSRLRGLIVAELQRLQALLDTRTVDELVEFDLAEAIAPVVEIHRLDGTQIEVDLAHLVVIGRVGTTATVVDNLVRNARRHAPGARIWLRGSVVGGTAVIVVEDDGPGIEAGERAQVLRSGVRGARARGDGEGLGLPSCLTAMTSMGGTLRLDERMGGGTRVTLTLPALALAPTALAG